MYSNLLFMIFPKIHGKYHLYLRLVSPRCSTVSKRLILPERYPNIFNIVIRNIRNQNLLSLRELFKLPYLIFQLGDIFHSLFGTSTKFLVNNVLLKLLIEKDTYKWRGEIVDNVIHLKRVLSDDQYYRHYTPPPPPSFFIDI